MQTDVQPELRNSAGAGELSTDGLTSMDWDLMYHITRDMGVGMERQRLLNKLEQSARPYVAKIVESKLGGLPEVEDIIQDIQSSLTQVWANRSPIDNMKGYIRRVSRCRCDQYLRVKYPNYFRCTEKVEYRLTSRPDFALWTVGQVKFGGLSKWQTPTSAQMTMGGARLELLLKSPYQTLCNLKALRDVDIRALKYADVVLAELFRYIGHPVLLKQLVPIFQDVWNLRDNQDEPLSDDTSDPLAEDNNPLVQMIAQHDRQYNPHTLWQQVKALPLRHRSVILLHKKLRDSTMPLIHALIIDGIASHTEIVRVLEFQPDVLTITTMRLPLETIAGMVGLPEALLRKLSQNELEAEILRADPEALQIHGRSLPLDYQAIGTLLECSPGNVARLNGQALNLLTRKRRASDEGGQH